MIKVGIVLMPDDNWLGGVNYYRNLIQAVNSLPNKKIEFVAITDPDKNINQLLLDFPCSEVIQTTLLKRFSLKWFVRKITTKVFKFDFLLNDLLKKNNVKVLTHSGWLGKNANIPTIGWIPDFQHVHLPDFFSKAELRARDRAFLDVCKLCTKVVVSSHDALNDLKKFSPEAVNKAVVINFAVKPKNEDVEIQGLEDLKSRYKFTTPFFLLPNQFWAHKNHKIVIEALAILKKQNVSITVLATGNTNDYRQPEFFPALQKIIAANDLTQEFKVLGMIPHADLGALFYYANAIINPSFFEGWSTVVEEAKALGKKIILSDIAIHQEQNPPFGFYFDPENADALASLLSQHVAGSYSVDSNAIRHAETIFIKYGAAYQSLVKQVLGLHAPLSGAELK